jgi:hypothetical protein
VLPRAFSKELGELTDLGKLRRDAVRLHFDDVIASLYG